MLIFFQLFTIFVPLNVFKGKHYEIFHAVVNIQVFSDWSSSVLQCSLSLREEPGSIPHYTVQKFPYISLWKTVSNTQ